MKIYFLFKDFFSLLNIGLIVYLLLISSEKKDKKTIKDFFTIRKVIGFFFVSAMRLLENKIQVHVFHIYLTVVIAVLVLGYIYERNNIMHNMLIAGIFLLIVSFSQVISGTAGYIILKGRERLYQLLPDKQIGLMAITEISIIVGVLLCVKIVKKIPSKISNLNFFTIAIPLIINITIMAFIGDDLYYNTDTYGTLEHGTYIISVVSMLIVGFVLIIGSICNIAVLEYYLNVKYIEAEKRIRINEMSQQYDYYIRLEKETDNIKRLAHDFRNHLEALKNTNDNKEKQEYIRSIEKRLERYECYYRTGNTFVDSLLQSKAQKASESDIEFKVIADFRPFRSMKNEDLCTIIANIVDNALRECSLMRIETPEEECFIQVKARKSLNFLWIYCENSIREKQEKIVGNATELKTTKDDKQNHGYGIKNVESAVNKYGGEISISIRDGLFCISITIPIKEES